MHNDYYARLLPRSDIPFVIHHTCSITVQKSRRYCVTLPEQRKSFSVPDLLHYNNIAKRTFARSKRQRHFTYKHRRKVPVRKCNLHKHKLFVKPKPGCLFNCDPKAQQKPGPLDASVLYPQKYTYTKPDTEFIFESDTIQT